MFEREDWTLFRTLGTLGQKAGVPAARLPRLIAKELADNALDAGGNCRVGLLDGDGFFVEDDGEGIPGDDEAIARLFSIRRPLISSKVLRRPTRGALGNGLRVVAGAVLASGGSLTVATGDRTLRLEPRDDTGESRVLRIGGFGRRGTRVEVRLGAALPVDRDALAWAREAILLAVGGRGYAGKSSPHWYDSDAFFELLQASVAQTVRELVASFDGCAEPRAGRIAAEFKGKLARDLGRAEAGRLLARARESTRPVKPNRLGCVGPLAGLPAGYAKYEGTLELRPASDGTRATLPVVVEAWVASAEGASLALYVNRTPAPVEVNAHHEKTALSLFGCGLAHEMTVGRDPVAVRINVATPFMPITSDGKAPDLRAFVDIIAELVPKAARRGRKSALGGAGTDRATTQKDVILKNLAASIAKAGGDGQYRFSIRQLFYAVRPYVLESLGQEPEYNYFTQVVTDHEGEHGDIPGIYRDPRGTLYHPHTGEEIALGTLNVERYRRPEWTFNKVLYCEKEGFFTILREVDWPERHDCALMSAKGFASRAARDVMDLLGETDEDLWFYCIHDADAYGTMIYQALQEGTRARGGRRVHIVNLGLEPDEAMAMGLQVEAVSRKGDKAAPVANYVAVAWREWLQAHRVELNAMTTPQFLGWLDRKFADQHGSKVVPPAPVLVDRLERETRSELERRYMAWLLRRGRLGERVDRALGRRLPAIRRRASTIEGDVRRRLREEPVELWDQPVRSLARGIAGSDHGGLA